MALDDFLGHGSLRLHALLGSVNIDRDLFDHLGLRLHFLIRRDRCAFETHRTSMERIKLLLLAVHQ